MKLEGAAVNSVDASGRITLRESLVDSLDGSVILTQGFDANLLMFSPEQWLVYKKPFTAEEQAGAMMDPDMEDLYRLLISPAAEVELDDRGRMKIPEALREWAGLTPGASRVVVLGLDTRWEIWSQEQYKSYMSSRRSELKDFVRGKAGRGSQEAEAEER